MRTSTLKLSVLAFLLCFGLSATAQQSSYYDYNYPWTFGINGGAAWQYSDVNGGLGYGFGIDLAKRVAGKEGSWFALDGRGRLLLARQYGQSYQRDYNVANFSALNGVDNALIDYTAANGGLGYAFHNQETTMGELDFEGVITLNRLRERTGWTVQGFAGIGLGLYNTKIDQTDAAGNLYTYNTIDTTQSKSRIRGDVRAIRDRVYETEGTGFADGIDATLMPSLGLGVGYQFTPRFSLGLEHKATWAMADNLDAVIDQNSNRANDVHHYTSVYMRWTLGDKKGKKPIIDVTAPNRSPYTVRVASGTIRAEIKNVTRRSGVTVNLNGQRIDYFDFNTGTEEFFLTVPLVEGQNTVTIYAQNDFGSDEESVVFIYEYQQNNGGNNNNNGGNNGGNNGNNNGGNNGGNVQNPPQVDITTPRNNPFNTTDKTINIAATVRNVSDRNDIRYTVNGNRNTNFKYSRGQLTSTVNLQDGNNVIEISAKNNRGEVRDTRTIVYTRPQIAAPKVTFLSPNRNPYTVSDDTYSIRTRIDNVTNNKNIRLSVNGKSEPFSFKNGTLSSLIDLRKGANVIEVSAYNDGGTDEASTTIVFEQKTVPATAPKVTITSPTKNPYNTNNASAKVTAVISNVASKNEVTFKVNGTSKTFNFKNNSQLSATVNLVEGNNTIEVLASNAGGKDNDFVNIVYKKAIAQTTKPPVITIKTPNTNPHTSIRSSEAVTAIVTGVKSKNDIRLLVNGKTTTKFTYSTNSNLLKATVGLNQGANTFEIIATNSGGTDKAGGTIVFKPQTPKLLPIITILNPTDNPHTSTSGFVNLKARIENVSSANDITLTIGGVKKTSFSFKNGILSIQFDIPKNGTTAVITAVNKDGQDKKSVQFKYNVPQVTPKPVINITAPNKSTYTSPKPNYTVQATIQNVTNKNQVTVKNNGKTVTNFTFANGKLKYALTIPNSGTNIKITATNAGGSDNKTVVLNYNKPKQPPVVTMINPKKSPYTSTSPSISIKARVQYVSGRNNITVMVNGSKRTGFTFTNEILTLLTDIPNNGATIVITATNADGKDAKTVKINYNKPVVTKPVVTITNPQRTPFTSKKPVFTLLATVQGVTSQRDITVKVDGNRVTKFTYGGGKVRLPLVLKNGSTRVDITATNTGGSDTKTAVLNYTAPKQPPVITVINPAKSPYAATKLVINLKARVQYVNSKNDITVKVNGSSKTGFSFNNEILALMMDLPKAGATIVITATNADGKDIETIRVNYTAPVAKPTIMLKSPAKTSTSTSQATQNLSVVVKNVTAKNQVNIRLNGAIVKNFNYSSNGAVTAQLPLKNGINNIIVTATNSGGTTTQPFAITRTTKGVIAPTNKVTAKPVITFITPTKANTTVKTNPYTVKAKVTNVTERANITIKVNGKAVKKFNYNPANGMLSFNGNFRKGNNIIIIVAKNKSGVATKTMRINSQPTVITKPNNGTKPKSGN